MLRHIRDYWRLLRSDFLRKMDAFDAAIADAGTCGGEHYVESYVDNDGLVQIVTETCDGSCTE